MRYPSPACTLVLAVITLCVGARAAPLSAVIEKAEIAPLARPHVAQPFNLMHAPVHDSVDADLTVSPDDELADVSERSSRARYLLHVQPRNPRHEVQVRERSVIYMNLSDDGPHHEIESTELRGAWHAVRRGATHQFRVGGLNRATLKLDARDVLKAVTRSALGNDERWLALARQCPAADQGPCYTVTDSEYEVSILERGRVIARGILRLRQPNGC